MSSIPDLLKDLNDLEKSAGGVEYDLRLDLSEIILRHLSEKGWTQRRLAAATGMKPSFVTRLIHSSNNWNCRTAARICHALGVRPKLMETAVKESVQPKIRRDTAAESSKKVRRKTPA
jgi:plasmid maintenance system antidote protein VapI